MSRVLTMRRKTTFSLVVSLALSAIAVFAVARLSEADHLTGQQCSAVGGYEIGYHGCVAGGGGVGAPPTASPTATPTETATGTATAAPTVTATAGPAGVTTDEVTPNGGVYVPGTFNAVVVTGGGTADEIIAAIAADSGRPVVIIWNLRSNNWLFAIPAFGANTFQGTTNQVDTVYALLQ